MLSRFNILTILGTCVLLLSRSQAAYSQHAVDFQIQSSVCVGENLLINNISDVGIANWDFCLGLDNYSSSPFTEIAPSLAGLSIIEHNGSWFGFALTQDSRLFRIEYGSNPVDNNFTITPLGNPGSLLSNPDWIDVIESNGRWYGLVTNQSNELVKLVWNDLKAAPVATSLNLKNSGKLSNPTQVEIMKDGNDYIAIIANADSRQLTLINFGPSMDATPAASDIILSPAFDGATNMYGVTAVQECGNWMIYTSVTNRLYKVNVGPQLFGSISQAQITEFTSDIPLQVGAYLRMRSTVEGGDTYVYFSSYTSNIVSAFVWRQSATQAEFIDLTSLANPGQLYSLALIKYDQAYQLFVGSFGSGALYVMQPAFSCAASQPTSNVFSPKGVFFTKPGSYSVYLKMTFSDGVQCSVRKQITVTASPAPDITFDYVNKCVNNDVFFTAQSASAITTYSWSFGDAQGSSLPDPIHQFTAADNYTVSLDVTADNGCHNSAEQIVQIFDRPTASFNLPLGLICTNNQFTFTNNTVDNFDGNLSYEWFVNDELKSTTRDFVYAFATTGDQQVKLKTSIPGCFSEQTQTLLGVQSGPVVGFSYTGKCEDENILFTNESSGSISGFEWSFGNGNTSTLQNPTQAYTEYGQYDVTLNTTGTNGCVSSLTKKLSIYSVPQTDFMIELPPFSCAGTASQFRDLTPSMPDSNVSSWQWSFGDGNNGTATTKNPQYTFALASNYNVLLKTTTNFGCSSTTQKTITIQPSPKADFDFANACVKQSTIFTDKSTGDIKSWNWLIQNFTDTKQNTAFSFQSAGTYTASLKVTATNNCISQITKNVLIPVAPQVDFSAIATCKDIATTLTGITSGGTDPVTNWMWDFGDGFSGDGATTTHVYTKDKIYSVVAKAVGQSGCVYPYTDEISIIKAPVAKFTVPLDAGPAPFNVPVTNLSSLATKYEWRSGIAGAQVDNSFSPSFTYSQLGDYTLELRASNDVGCVAVAQQKISVVIPQISASMVDFRLERIPGNTAWRPMAIIKNNSNVAITDPEIFLDISGSGLVSEKLFGLIKPNQTDTLIFNSNLASRALNYVCAYLMVNADVNKYDDRECIDVASQFTSITPYPNPANEYVMLEWVSQTQEPLKVTIYNEAGQCVLSRTYDSTREGLNQVKVDVSQLRAGIYFITYELAGQSQHHRFSVVR